MLTYVILRGARPGVPDAIKCLICQRVSYDVAERYCGFCHRFHEDVAD
jgi:ribosomal protein L37E